MTGPFPSVSLLFLIWTPCYFLLYSPRPLAGIADSPRSSVDQDERLNLLSNSIGRQNHLSIQIGSELDLHHDLLEDTDQAMDRTTARLSTAKRRLDKVASDAKKYGGSSFDYTVCRC